MRTVKHAATIPPILNCMCAPRGVLYSLTFLQHFPDLLLRSGLVQHTPLEQKVSCFRCLHQLCLLPAH